jgi:hypothetical protein
MSIKPNFLNPGPLFSIKGTWYATAIRTRPSWLVMEYVTYPVIMSDFSTWKSMLAPYWQKIGNIIFKIWPHIGNIGHFSVILWKHIDNVGHI